MGIGLFEMYRFMHPIFHNVFFISLHIEMSMKTTKLENTLWKYNILLCITFQSRIMANPKHCSLSLSFSNLVSVIFIGHSVCIKRSFLIHSHSSRSGWEEFTFQCGTIAFLLTNHIAFYLKWKIQKERRNKSINSTNKTKCAKFFGTGEKWLNLKKINN